MVAEAFLLLVGAVVFLVDDDQPSLRQRREYRRAGAQDHPRTARAGAQPGARTVALGQVRMQHLDDHPEPLAQAPHGLRRQADLRYQQQRLFALRQYLLDQCQINLGLAAAGNAIEQERLVLAETGADRGDGLLLFVAELGRQRRGQRTVEWRPFAAFEQAGASQSTGRFAPAGQTLGQLLRAQRAIGQQCQQRLAAAAPAAGIVGAVAGLGERPVFVADGRQRFRLAQGQRQRIGVRLARRAKPVVGGPGQGVHQFRIEQGPVVEQSQHLLQPVATDRRLGVYRHHHADHSAAAERDQYPAAHACLTGRGRQIVEQGRQGYRQGDTEYGGHGLPHGRPV